MGEHKTSKRKGLLNNQIEARIYERKVVNYMEQRLIETIKYEMQQIGNENVKIENIRMKKII